MIKKARTKLIGERCILITIFGDKIRRLREEKKMTQQKLGAMVGVSYRTIRAWEVEG